MKTTQEQRVAFIAKKVIDPMIILFFAITFLFYGVTMTFLKKEPLFMDNLHFQILLRIYSIWEWLSIAFVILIGGFVLWAIWRSKKATSNQ